MSKTKFLAFLFLAAIFLSGQRALACEIGNITGNTAQRQGLFAKENLPGVRVGIGGMKDANGKYGLGKVNDSLSSYEKRLCQKLAATKGMSAKIVKTDFKGYYVTCSPMPSCLDGLEKTVAQVGAPELPEGEKLQANSVKASNYSEGYIKARAVSEYPGKTSDFDSFVKEELEAGIKEATGNSRLESVDPDDEKFMRQLSQNVENYRKKGIEAVDPKFRRLVKGLDNLMEVPFVNSNNIEEELDHALSGKGASSASDFKVSAAQTGDDLFVVIRQGDEVQKVVGADARGLGVTNMTSRYKELALAYSEGRPPAGVKDVMDLSGKAVERADASMDKSLGLYKKLVIEELEKGPGDSLDQAVKAAHDRYNEMAKTDPDLMAVRAGAINNCGSDQGKIMNRITAIHNRLKIMEAAGHDGVFGASCLGAEYLILKHGLSK